MGLECEYLQEIDKKKGMEYYADSVVHFGIDD
jgi:hypothetical protein